MKKQLIVLIFACMIVCLCFIGCQSQNKINEILQEVSAFVDNHADLPETYRSAVYYCSNDFGEYLLVRNGGKAVVGQRQADGNTVWKYSESYWRANEQNVLEETDFPDWWNEEIHRKIIEEYWSIEPVKYTSKPVRGGALPLGVVPQDGDYLYVVREQMPNDMETMVFFNEKSTKYIRWSVYNADAAKIYLFAANYPISGDVIIPGWGELPSEINAILGAEQLLGLLKYRNFKEQRQGQS